MDSSMEPISIRYRFTLADGSQESFDLQMNAENLVLLQDNREVEVLPAWTELTFHQCPHCPLQPETHPRCPLAESLVNIVTRFERLISYDQIHLEVVTKERVCSNDTTIQTGISSLIGLVMATSGCPYTAFFKPMARFHLPLASVTETIYRAASMYLLAQYFLKKDGRKAELGVDGLKTVYQNIHIVNTSITERLRAASTTDSLKNAVVVLDMYTFAFTDIIQETLKHLRYLFTAFLGRKK